MPSPSNGFERSPRWAVQVVGDRNRLRENPFAEPVLQKARAAGNDLSRAEGRL
jgi:hypothetical protein